MRGAVPIGFLPGGATNVLPRALGLPNDCVAAARRLAGGERIAPDLARAGSLSRWARGRAPVHVLGRRRAGRRARARGRQAREAERKAIRRPRLRLGARPHPCRATRTARAHARGRRSWALRPRRRRQLRPVHLRRPLQRACHAPRALRARARRRRARAARPDAGSRGSRGGCWFVRRTPERRASCTSTTPTGWRSAATVRCRCRWTARTSATWPRSSSKPSGYARRAAPAYGPRAG